MKKEKVVDVLTGEITSYPQSIPFFRSPYNYSMEDASDASALRCLDETRTIQSGKEEADINTIVKRFNLTGQLPTNVQMPQYGNYVDVPDFRTSLEIVIAGEKAFSAMPADIRSRFGNDPALFLEFFEKPENKEEAIRLGLAVKPEPPKAPAEPIQVMVVDKPETPKGK